MAVDDVERRQREKEEWGIGTEKSAGLPIVSIPAFVVANMAAQRNKTKPFIVSLSSTLSFSQLHRTKIHAPLLASKGMKFKTK
jgi:hypothetical protein